MQDILLRARVAVRSSSMQKFASKSVPHVQHDFFLIQSYHLIWDVVVAFGVSNSLVQSWHKEISRCWQSSNIIRSEEEYIIIQKGVRILQLITFYQNAMNLTRVHCAANNTRKSQQRAAVLFLADSSQLSKPIQCCDRIIFEEGRVLLNLSTGNTPWFLTLLKGFNPTRRRKH